MIIDSFRGEYRFLSNFYPCLLTFDDRIYRSVEHAFQASKTLNEQCRAEIQAAGSPAAAKGLGRRAPLRPYWDALRVPQMKLLLLGKFQYPDLAEKLLATGNAELVEGNTWGDTYWGAIDMTRQGAEEMKVPIWDKYMPGIGSDERRYRYLAGHNFLGRLLMEVRDEISS